MTLRLRLLNALLRFREKPLLARATDPAPVKQHFDTSARLTTWSPRGTRFKKTHVQHNGTVVPVKWINRNDDPTRPVLFYIHGGAFIMGSPDTHSAMLATLSKLTGLSACLPYYPLAPEHPFPAALNDLVAAYQAVAAHPGGVIIGGDSAGGCLVLTLLGQILRGGLSRPMGCFAFSPLTDMTFSGDSFKTNAQVEALLPAKQAETMTGWYLAGHDPTDPRVSPLFAEFSGACPVWLTVGSTEILRDDSMRLAQRLRDSGVDVSFEIKPNHPHVWPYFHNFLPEGRQTLRDVAEWINTLQINDRSTPANDS